MKDPSALAYLAGLKESRIRPGLERIQRALVFLGSPHNDFPHVIVGGTNGKGSVVALMSSVLQAAGFSVGCFTSPHLYRFEERIVTDGEQVNAEELEDLVGTVKGSGVDLSYFEYATAMALLHFSRRGVDIALLEVGLGGRWDATNATDPLVSVISSVDMDHAQWLGDSVEKIAAEKARILRPGRPLVVNGTGVSALETILMAASAQGAIPVVAGRDFYWGADSSGRSMWFRGRRLDLSGLSPGLPGLFQFENTATALACLECLDERGFSLNPSAIEGGLVAARWPARFHDLGGSPGLLVDAAHNPAAVRCLVRSLGGRGRIVWLFSALADKDIEGMGRSMLEAGEDFVLVPLENPRAGSLKDLAGRMPVKARVRAASTVAEGLRLALSLAGREGTVVSAGSIYLAAEVLREAALRKNGPGGTG